MRVDISPLLLRIGLRTFFLLKYKSFVHLLLSVSRSLVTRLKVPRAFYRTGPSGYLRPWHTGRVTHYHFSVDLNLRPGTSFRLPLKFVRLYLLYWRAVVPGPGSSCPTVPWRKNLSTNENEANVLWRAGPVPTSPRYWKVIFSLTNGVLWLLETKDLIYGILL